MILTVTMNPSVDTRYQLDELIIDDVNRVTPEKTAGGTRDSFSFNNAFLFSSRNRSSLLIR